MQAGSGRLYVPGVGLALLLLLFLLGCYIPHWTTKPYDAFYNFLLLQGFSATLFALFVMYSHHANNPDLELPLADYDRNQKRSRRVSAAIVKQVIATCPGLSCYAPLLLLLIAFPPMLYLSSIQAHFWSSTDFTTLHQGNWHSFVSNHQEKGMGLGKEEEWHRFNDTRILGEYTMWGEITRGKVKWGSGMVTAPLIFENQRTLVGENEEGEVEKGWDKTQEIPAWAFWEGPLEYVQQHRLYNRTVWDLIWRNPRVIREGYVWTFSSDVRKDPEREALVNLAVEKYGLKKGSPIICITAASIKEQQDDAIDSYFTLRMTAYSLLVAMGLVYMVHIKVMALVPSVV